MSTREKIALGVLTLILAILWNGQFLDRVSLPLMLEMNDVPSILQGYHKVPNLLTDSGVWWRGSWIQENIYAFRPLASYLYWMESWLGLKAGFFWVGCIGIVLLTINSWLCAALAWRLTRSKPAVFLAGVLAVALRFFNMSGTPVYWVLWYPIHQELLMNIFLMGATLYFDLWIEKGSGKYLGGSWLCFLAGIFTKEHVYIFPAFALAVALRRRQESRVEVVRAVLHCAMMMLVVEFVWLYRASIILHPRNPEVRKVYFVKKPWLYLFFPLYPFMLTRQYWFPGWALLIFASIGGLIRWHYSRWRDVLHRPGMSVVITVVWISVMAAYCQQTYGSFMEAIWYIFETSNQMIRLQQLIIILGLYYSLWLLLKYRKSYPTGAAFALLVLSYTPVISYLGWHYTVPAWFMRSVYWGVVAHLVWLDIWPILERRISLASWPFAADLSARLKPVEAK